MKLIKKEELANYSQEQLVTLADELQQKLKKKNEVLYQLRVKLGAARSRISTMKDKVDYQRKRILELYQ